MPPKNTNSRKGDKSPELVRLTAEALTTVQLPQEEIPVPLLGGSVLIQAFSGRVAREVRTLVTHLPDPDNPEQCMACKGPSPCIKEGEFDQDLYERYLVYRGVIDPKLSEDEVAVLFDDQFSGIGRAISLRVLAINATGLAGSMAKDSGQIMTTDSDSS